MARAALEWSLEDAAAAAGSAAGRRCASSATIGTLRPNSSRRFAAPTRLPACGSWTTARMPARSSRLPFGCHRRPGGEGSRPVPEEDREVASS